MFAVDQYDTAWINCIDLCLKMDQLSAIAVNACGSETDGYFICYNLYLCRWCQ